VTEDGAQADAPAPGGLPEPFLEELRAAFNRFEPVGTLEWNFADAFNRLEREFGVWANFSPLIGDIETPPAPPRNLRQRFSHRLAVRNETTPDHQNDVLAARAHVDSVLGDGRGRVDSGFDATLEALRFLAARVGRLEEALRRTQHPIEGLAQLVEPTQWGAWVPTLATWLEPRVREGEVLCAECGDGALLGALVERGVRCIGVEPRGELVQRASRYGSPVELEEVTDALSRRAANTLGGLVLSGVVDRASMAERLGLLADGARALMPGAPIVIAGGSAPDSPSALAHDLLPGKAFQPETWELLLDRAGFGAIERLAAPPSLGADSPRYVVTGRDQR
jgi:hypothetical protein